MRCAGGGGDYGEAGHLHGHPHPGHRGGRGGAAEELLLLRGVGGGGGAQILCSHLWVIYSDMYQLFHR